MTVKAILDIVASDEFKASMRAQCERMNRAARDAKVAAGELAPRSPEAEFFASLWDVTEDGARPCFPSLWEVGR